MSDDKLQQATEEIKRLQGVISSANDALFDISGMDVEHQIRCHPDTIAESFRLMTDSVSQAMQILQAEIRKMVSESE